MWAALDATPWTVEWDIILPMKTKAQFRTLHTCEVSGTEEAGHLEVPGSQGLEPGLQGPELGDGS